ncbi:MAG TPA: hypothetical protein VF695_11840 [Sphingomonas sp.]
MADAAVCDNKTAQLARARADVQARMTNFIFPPNLRASFEPIANFPILASTY